MEPELTKIMKTDETPWPVIRWMAAGMIYLLTLAIAVNQVKTRQARIDELEAGLRGIDAGLGRMQENNAASQEATENAIRMLEEQEARKNAEVIGTLKAASGK